MYFIRLEYYMINFGIQRAKDGYCESKYKNSPSSIQHCINEIEKLPNFELINYFYDDLTK